LAAISRSRNSCNDGALLSIVAAYSLLKSHGVREL
jgi:hypothetical protein